MSSSAHYRRTATRSTSTAGIRKKRDTMKSSLAIPKKVLAHDIEQLTLVDSQSDAEGIVRAIIETSDSADRDSQELRTPHRACGESMAQGQRQISQKCRARKGCAKAATNPTRQGHRTIAREPETHRRALGLYKPHRRARATRPNAGSYEN